MKKKRAVILLFAVLVLIGGCKKKKDVKKSQELDAQAVRIIATDFLNEFLLDKTYTGADGEQYGYPTIVVPDYWNEVKKTKQGWELRIECQTKGLDVHLTMDSFGQNIKVISYSWSPN